MAPEFYFRPPTATGANYDSDTYPTAIAAEVISAFDTMFQHNDFDNWLIIPGTVLWNGPAPDAVNKLFYNTALHVRGGAVNQPTRIIEKKIASGIDGVPSAYTPGGYADLVPFYQRWAVRKSRSFSSGGINFGLDICLDHLAAVRLKVCKQVLHDWPVQEGNVQDAQIHLLTAGGMTINDTSVAATVNGYILRNDGYANAPRSQQKKINKYTNGAEDSTPSNMNSKALMAIDAVADASIVLVGDECVPNKDGGVFIFPQRIVVYPITGPI
ncbi:hypothetical protein [Colwellia sp. MB02u-14]|uniref:hypothetical protein n=1 Tax=Colwellia sp. MB02u-14 TaxID=2759815 RepID=UPI0015F4F318|nr:hypothetical protein [Colwellia sp. MB02u-14]MBA6304200.1 hypothetical protein [Colwellia sp. MB02u-14]